MANPHLSTIACTGDQSNDSIKGGDKLWDMVYRVILTLRNNVMITLIRTIQITTHTEQTKKIMQINAQMMMTN